jgi:hypothetical protein
MGRAATQTPLRGSQTCPSHATGVLWQGNLMPGVTSQSPEGSRPSWLLLSSFSRECPIADESPWTYPSGLPRLTVAPYDRRETGIPTGFEPETSPFRAR